MNLLLYVEPARCFPISRKSKKESKLELAFVGMECQMLSYYPKNAERKAS